MDLKRELKNKNDKINAVRNGQIIDYSSLDQVYVGTISLGTPLQDINVAFDTESGILWVPDNNCPCAEECSIEALCYDLCSPHCCSQKDNTTTLLEDLASELNAVCTNKNVYNPKTSSSYISRRKQLDQSFLEDNITVNLAYETVRLGPHHTGAFTTKFLAFGHVSDLPEPYDNAAFDGVFGIGRAGPNGEKAPIKQLAEKRVISSAVVTISLSDTEDEASFYDGVLSIGQVDQSLCSFGSKNFVPVASSDRWNFRVFTAVLNSTKFSDLTWTARVDPSTPYIHIPKKIFDKLRPEFTYVAENDRYTVERSTGLKMFGEFRISIGNTTPLISSKKVLIGAGSELEVLVRPSVDGDDSWVLGRPFLRGRCAALDYDGRIGLAVLDSST
ncbi:unnamed protein product [Bursaphelenchus okinawaensis]|uniref:Peptidase A1 domain-containing protein n=1 Tax=Bursaphelenchus okinawaensis TaxID=465554 RepID=A0A811KCY8_9BILA|nr:unnamed protein product [Bursaphelenchus okinawaensis]CAG9100705.1 unnamed protein product [Bursaphelenchus okinawaensis]